MTRLTCRPIPRRIEPRSRAYARSATRRSADSALTLRPRAEKLFLLHRGSRDLVGPSRHVVARIDVPSTFKRISLGTARALAVGLSVPRLRRRNPYGVHDKDQ